jgi:general secretion pathway protein I
VIVALGMIAAISAVSQSARNGAYLREKTLAHWIAMNVITERRLQTSPPDVAESTGQVDFAGQRWQWTMTVTQTAVETMRRMDVSVRLADAPDNSSLTRLSGFYGTAVGTGGAASVSWGGAGAPGGGDLQEAPPDEDGDNEDVDRSDRRGPPRQPPPESSDE